MENHMRSVLKTVSFRLIGTLTTIILVFIFTREIAASLQVGAAEFLTKMLLYYFHERLWNMSRFGRD
ncbi:MAG: DUF2061 domain-containing protein [Candidatus Bathyarchaeota archaeon]|nr:MAG: DUF2061 domain-containing protein [Candidatus Bathyarchaeota archaeon]